MHLATFQFGVLLYSADLGAEFRKALEQFQTEGRMGHFTAAETNRNLDLIAMLGVTGSGKTFTVANVIANVGKPTLILSHNKTLAAQLYQEMKGFFPENAVEYYPYDGYCYSCVLSRISI